MALEKGKVSKKPACGKEHISGKRLEEILEEDHESSHFGDKKEGLALSNTESQETELE